MDAFYCLYGLLGPNGAGKTTTVVRDARTVRQKVSLTGQYASVDEDLTGTENMVLVGRLLFVLQWRARDRASVLAHTHS